MMDDMSAYRPPMNPAFVKRVNEKRRREKEKRLADERKAKLERKLFLKNQKQMERDMELRRLHEKIKKANEDLDFTNGLVPAKEIITLVARKHELSPLALVGRSRQKHVVKARFEAIAEVHRLRPDFSSCQIGKIFNRDHTSILHVFKKMNAEREAA